MFPSPGPPRRLPRPSPRPSPGGEARLFCGLLDEEFDGPALRPPCALVPPPSGADDVCSDAPSQGSIVASSGSLSAPSYEVAVSESRAEGSTPKRSFLCSSGSCLTIWMTCSAYAGSADKTCRIEAKMGGSSCGASPPLSISDEGACAGPSSAEGLSCGCTLGAG